MEIDPIGLGRRHFYTFLGSVPWVLTVILMSAGFKKLPQMFGESLFWTTLVAILLLAIWVTFVHMPAIEIEKGPATYFAKAAAVPSSILALGQTAPDFIRFLTTL